MKSKFPNSKTVKAFALLTLASIIGGCSTAPSHTALSDEIITKNKSDMDGLYKSWIAPLRSRNGFISNKAGERSEAGIRDGFNRFCLASGGVITKKIEPYNSKYSCSTPSGVFIGEIETNQAVKGLLRVTFDSPKRIKFRDEQLKAYELSKTKNGPTGMVLTNSGEFRFTRIGNLKERHVLSFPFDGQRIPIEEVAKIEFPGGKCCDFDITLRDGRKKKLNIVSFNRQTGSNSFSTYGYGTNSFSIVLLDPESNQPYTSLFPHMDGIHAILFDQASIWENMSAEPITTTFDPLSQERISKYVENLKIDSNKIYFEADKNGWLKQLPGGKFTPQMMSYLKNELDSITRDYSRCRDSDVVKGIVNFDKPLLCHVADRERKLIFTDGYLLSTDITPLSLIIILNKIKRDLD